MGRRLTDRSPRFHRPHPPRRSVASLWGELPAAVHFFAYHLVVSSGFLSVRSSPDLNRLRQVRPALDLGQNLHKVS